MKKVNELSLEIISTELLCKEQKQKKHQKALKNPKNFLTVSISQDTEYHP
jgi:hypothetical protein